MSNELPIRLIAPALPPQTLARTTAWANFETLKANWYGDEEKVADIEIEVVSPERFDTLLKDYQNEQSLVVEQHGFALRLNVPQLKVSGVMALDVDEPKLAKTFKLRVKKVLLVVAASLSLPSI